MNLPSHENIFAGRVIIVDDEPLARQSLEMALAKFAHIEIVASCSNGYQALEAVRTKRPDLLFLDIRMPELNGFEVLELLGAEAPPVIFVTAYDQYAIKAFEAQAIDYLLKPVEPQRLKQALQRVRKLEPGRAEQLARNSQSGIVPLERILIRDGNDVRVIPVDRISHITAQDDFVEIHAGRQTWLKYDRLSRLEEDLDRRRFVRIHRSHLLNVAYLHKIETTTTGSRQAILTTGARLAVSKSGYKNLSNFL